MSSIVENFVKKHGAVRHDPRYSNPLVGTTYTTVGLGDDLTAYSVVGEHSSCSADWLKSKITTPWDDLTDWEKTVLTKEVMATINPEYPNEVPYRLLIENFAVAFQGLGELCWSCGLQNRIKHAGLKLYWVGIQNPICVSLYCKTCYDQLLADGQAFKKLEDIL